MPAGQLTIAETVSEIQIALQDYIEATYHVGDPALVEQRRELLEREGVLFRAPYIESTPRYTSSRRFADLDIPPAGRDLLHRLAHPGDGGTPLLHDPPYKHQATALEATIRDGKSLVVTTGTGSGKTETFLLPIIAKLAQEAEANSGSFAQPAIRALLLYPMNALVNDQLGRLRLLFGDPMVTTQFAAWADRPARFARYTSRTLYPGVRTSAKDSARLRSVERFYIALLNQASDPEDPRHARAQALVANLQRRGKWPAKRDLRAWFGAPGTRWKNSAGHFVRAVLQPDDPELLTRHEVLSAPPDVLVTNYSMLEYMLMRPLERPVFDATREWLAENPEERLLLVIDEAHLYRGAAGAEVALLLRRLRARLAIPADRLQVICTSASFHNRDYAREFAAQLAGKALEDFETVVGELDLRPDEDLGSEDDARALAGVALRDFYEAEDNDARVAAIETILEHRAVGTHEDYEAALYAALHDFPPMRRLVNLTMQQAMPLSELAGAIFDTADSVLAERAVTSLIALGSTARLRPGEPGLLPCRVHAFFRGLPGLWACIDPACRFQGDAHAGSPIGALYSQPQDTCDCGARVFELYTCRNCGSAYARAYTDNVESPRFLWNEPGGGYASTTGNVPALEPIDLLLEEPTIEVEPADLDIPTGRLNPPTLGDRTRRVFLRHDRLTLADDDDDGGPHAHIGLGEFKPCGVCGTTATYGRTPVQDHQTKGDQPFQALVTRQIEVQPPGAQPYSDFAPLQGRKVLAFSDSRQTAARLAPNLQTYSMRDVLRPVILTGWRRLEAIDLLAPLLSLDDVYLAALVGATVLKVRLRPELKGTESIRVLQDVAEIVERDGLDDPAEVLQLRDYGAEPPPYALLSGLVSTINDRYLGLRSLGLASLRERGALGARLLTLPDVPGAADDDSQKLALARLWLEQWATPTAGIWFRSMDDRWSQTRGGVKTHTGKFRSIEQWLPDAAARRVFNEQWLPALLEAFCETRATRQYRMRAAHLALEMSGEWGYCQACRTTQRPFPGSNRCTNCRREQLVVIDPGTDTVFAARKKYYRSSSVRALGDPPQKPLAIIAAEHTAQLNAAQSDEVFSKAEEHELLFQDVDIGTGGPGEQAPTAIDVLSCTTTMEVGIDIGTLSGVALRNMPPSRASYQQRAGRAGRRGNAVATVVAFGSADSHDEHYFGEPDAMIRGSVDDPTLTLDNAEIARRHVTAYLFQRYHSERLPEIDPESQPQLFEVLGTVGDFMDDSSPLNRHDFETWLIAHQEALAEEINEWLPAELSEADRESLLANLVPETLAPVDAALGHEPEEMAGAAEEGQATGSEEDAIVTEAPPEAGEEGGSPNRAVENLLDRLLYRGVLPRYAFPTDVVSFYVFDRDRSTRFRPEFRYAPSQGLSVALTQYAPGKEVWIDGKLWVSGALYSPMPDDRFEAWQGRELYFECEVCHYALTASYDDADRGERRDCPACNAQGRFGPAKNWLRPPGFAHPQSIQEGTSLDDQPARSYATRAKLVASGPAEADKWQPVTQGIRQYYDRRELLVSNTGPRGEGYTYCTVCGLIEPTAIPSGVVSGSHPKPYPDDRQPDCDGGRSSRALVLGTKFISDVVLISLSVAPPLTLRPGLLATEVALRTLSEAITIAAAKRLDIERQEVQAEFRPALSPGGHQGLEAEIYIYDTLPGGAGFARRIADLGVEVYQDALRLLEECPAGCDRSCYRCLRSFKNRFEHHLLDRHVGASLLRYLVNGDPPALSERRIEQAADRLFSDLDRQGLDGVGLARRRPIEVPGLGEVTAPILAEVNGRQSLIAIHGPLTPDYLSDEYLQDAKEFGAIPVIAVDEIMVSLNLPAASKSVIEAIL
ncbi:MAG: hypothetical protein QOJ29_87 [Thermoleophilaceae bacterium]|jgi:ATP-dependent helicase YprA (DUF1998 family)|nr:hypothetical protein [Thermoleophilaceae bacterium]